MKVIGYTIIYFLLSMLLLWGCVEFEIWMYKTKWLTGKMKDDFIGINIFIVIIIFIILWFTDALEPIDKLLKKHIL